MVKLALKSVCAIIIEQNKLILAKQSKQYDKIFKENFEGLIYSLARVVLKIDPNSLEEIPDETQYTIEKQPDFLKKVRANRPEEEAILQIEVQVTDPFTMRKRMLIYYGFLYHDYGIPIKQYVLYIGKKEAAKMPTTIQHENLTFRFHVLNIADLDHEQFLYSNRPEDIVISILCDFKQKSADNVLDTILKRLQAFSKDELELGKYLKQLEVLSNLRNLQAVTIKKLSAMQFFYDIETDIRFQQGYEKAKEEAELKVQEAEMRIQEVEKEAEKAAQEAEMRIQEAVVKNMLQSSGLTKEQIAEFSNTDVVFVEKIAQQLLDKRTGKEN